MHAGLKVPWLNEMKDVFEKIFERSLLPCFQCLLHAITVCTVYRFVGPPSDFWHLRHKTYLCFGHHGQSEQGRLWARPIEDELEFIRAMKQAGFDVHVPWQMGLLVPGGEPLNNFSKRFGFLCRQIELLRLNGYFDINLINDKTWTSRRVGHGSCVRWGLPINPNGTFTCMAGWCSGVQRRKVTTCFWPHLKWYEPEECQKPCSPMKLSPSLNQLKKLNGLIKWGWTRQRVQHNVALKYGTPCTSSCWPAARPSRNMPNHWWGQGMRWWSVTCTCTVEIMGWVPAHWCQILQQTMLSFGTSWWNSRTRNLSQLHYGVRRGFQAICATSGSSTRWSCSHKMGQWFQHWRQRSLLLGCVFCYQLATDKWYLLVLWYNWHMTTGNPCYNWHMTTGNPCYNWHMTTGTWQQHYF